jgi:HEAT repeat protein
MSGPTRYCPACYGPNAWEEDRCIACGTTLQTDESYDERLLWALDHPDSGIAVLASQVLAARDARQAIERLIAMVDDHDPYRAASAARALTEFRDDPRATAAVAACRDHPSALVRRAVAEPLEPERQG